MKVNLTKIHKILTFNVNLPAYFRKEIIYHHNIDTEYLKELHDLG
jgi:hypothetical protein